jgi:hypothetical protein
LGGRVIDISRAICRTRDAVRPAGSVCPGGPRALEDFLRLQTAVPLLVDHGALIDSRGVIADMGAGAPVRLL